MKLLERFYIKNDTEITINYLNKDITINPSHLRITNLLVFNDKHIDIKLKNPIAFRVKPNNTWVANILIKSPGEFVPNNEILEATCTYDSYGSFIFKTENTNINGFFVLCINEYDEIEV